MELFAIERGIIIGEEREKVEEREQKEINKSKIVENLNGKFNKQVSCEFSRRFPLM